MNKYLKFVVVTLFFAATLLSCKKDEEKSPQENLVGKWIIESSEILGTTIPGDGSYLRFNACASECSGMDYLASDSTSGTFIYLLAEDASTIEITDTSSDGGSYNGTWDILELTDSDLRVVGNTILGSLKIELVKQN